MRHRIHNKNFLRRCWHIVEYSKAKSATTGSARGGLSAKTAKIPRQQMLLAPTTVKGSAERMRRPAAA
jgi:hypothetical protein